MLTVGKKGPSRVLVPQLSWPLGGLWSCSPCSLLYPSDSVTHSSSPLFTSGGVYGPLETSMGEEADHSSSSPEEWGTPRGRVEVWTLEDPLAWGWRGDL